MSTPTARSDLLQGSAVAPVDASAITVDMNALTGGMWVDLLLQLVGAGQKVTLVLGGRPVAIAGPPRITATKPPTPPGWEEKRRRLDLVYTYALRLDDEGTKCACGFPALQNTMDLDNEHDAYLWHPMEGSRLELP